MKTPVFSCPPKVMILRSTFSRYQEKIKAGMTLEKNFYPEQRVSGRGQGRWTGTFETVFSFQFSVKKICNINKLMN